MFEGRYQYDGWLYAIIVILRDMIEEHQLCKSNAALHMKQDTNIIEKMTLQPKLRLTCKNLQFLPTISSTEYFVNSQKAALANTLKRF